MIMILRQLLILTAAMLTFFGCRHADVGTAEPVNRQPDIKPDYRETTIPPNIAPFNFIIEEHGNTYSAEFSTDNGYHFKVDSRNGKVQIPEKKWEKIINAARGDKIKVTIVVGDDDNNYRKYEPF